MMILAESINSGKIKRSISQERNPAMVLKMLRKMVKNGKLSSGPGRNLELEKIIEYLDILEPLYKDDNRYQWEARSVVV